MGNERHPPPGLLARDHQQLLNDLAEAQAELRRLGSLLDRARECERAAHHLAHHDGLTALPNRRAFIHRLDQALARGAAHEGQLAVLFIDLDDFKHINDTHGHHVGDQLLTIVGRRLAQGVRVTDMVARLGGDEFACLLMHTASLTHVGKVATKLFHRIAAPVQLGALRLQVKPSIGIAVCPQGRSMGVEQLMGSADRAMFHAKRSRSRYHLAGAELPG